MKTIGVIGGLGPMATAYYLELIARMTDAGRDQEHPRIYMLSLPDIPDRTAYILGKSEENPSPVLSRAAQELQGLGAHLITIPCITAHYYYNDLTENLAVPVIHLPRTLAQDVAAKGICQVGLLATTGTIQSQVLEKEMEAAGVQVLVPDAARQDKVMQIIYGQIKKGMPVQWEMFYEAAASLQEKGAERLILGCTELPLLKRDMGQAAHPAAGHILRHDCIDVLEVLAQHAVLEAEAPLKEEYADVIYK